MAYGPLATCLRNEDLVAHVKFVIQNATLLKGKSSTQQMSALGARSAFFKFPVPKSTRTMLIIIFTSPLKFTTSE